LVSPSVSGEPLRHGEREEAWARILLSRWGVVRRDVLEREDAVRWSDVAPVLARLEMRGDLRRGEFVEGGGPMQYAEEETVEALRRLRDAPLDTAAPILVVSGADPVLAGLAPPPDRDELVALRRGEVVLRLTSQGALALGALDAQDEALRAAFTEMQELKRRARDPVGRPRRLTVAAVDGAPISGSWRFATLLTSLGFHRDRGAYAWRAL
jgi:ATP-dependent Lhr-like helicase